MSRAGQPRGGAAVPAEIVERFSGRLRLFAAHRLGDASEAEDVTQETLRCVLEAVRADRVQNLDALAGFVFQTARNICLKKIRGETRRKRAFDKLASATAEAGHRNPLLELIDRERRAKVRQAVSKLGVTDRDLLRWLYVEGISLEDAGRRLGISVGAVRVRKHRALRRLGRDLGDRRYGEIE